MAQNNKQSLKRKSNTEQNSDSNDTLSNDESIFTDTNDKNKLWRIYDEVCQKLFESTGEERTAEECVTRTRFVDCTSLKLVSDIQKLNISSNNTWDQISRHINGNWEKFFNNRTDDWSIGNMIPLNLYKSHFFGSKELLTKKNNLQVNTNKSSQKKAKTRRKDDIAKVAKPREGMLNDKQLPLIEHMARVKKALKEEFQSNGKQSIPYFKFVLHPTSFSSTVYNIFTLSFLLREAQIKITTGSNHGLFISPSQSQSSTSTKRSHSIIDLTFSEWEMLVDRLCVNSPMITCPNETAGDDGFYQRFISSQKPK